eukprot:c12622_g2_i2.p1 GENE.c12622_g2_i2~~c12622_g2_i2.p1  ORF type:complete len:1051 (+),score=340.05 c12622_g2_i2:118-3270(+)
MFAVVPRVRQSRSVSVITRQVVRAYSTVAQKKAWQPGNPDSLQRVMTQSLVHELTQAQVGSANKLVPWFLKNMPEAYFRQVSEETRLEHLKAMSALYGSTTDLSLTLKSRNSNGEMEITYIRPSNQIGLLHELVEDLPTNFGQLRRMMVFTSQDSSLALNIFTFAEKMPEFMTPTADLEHILDYARKVQAGEYLNDPSHVKPAPYLEREALISFLQTLDPKHLLSSDPRRLLKHVKAYHTVAGTENVDLDIEETVGDSDLIHARHHTHWITLSLGNVAPTTVLRGLTTILKTFQLDIIRSHLNLVVDKDSTVTLVRVLVGTMENVPEPDRATWQSIMHSLKHMKWLDDDAIHLGAVAHPSIGLKRAEVITGFCSLLHGMLSKENSWTFSKTNILNMVAHPRYIKHAAAIADLFMRRFNPAQPMPEAEFTHTREDLAHIIHAEVEDVHAAKLLLTMLDAVSHVYRTNFFMDSRYAFGVRLNPKIFSRTDDGREVPFGVFFIHGRKFNSFHLRFRDIARGGMRLVTPASREQFALESTRHYDEVYNLAFAQQLKNKDIPEGGSKCVLLIDTIGMNHDNKHQTMRKSVKAFTDSLLDMIVRTPGREQCMVDLLNVPEHLYLGPDEQVLPEDISWIVNRAANRGLPAPSTFMSSKANEGINHKEFGVTSEGVTVYLDVALRYIGINPATDSFTVKITGGPNGDVGGNCINILFREYGPRVRIVGVADHSGSAEDPNGLDKNELLRLFREERAIEDYSPAKLGPRGALHKVDTEEGTKMRNTMHNRVVADAFIPAGGRPGTISGSNWRQFLRKDGSPSSRVIVEGANLFITPEARLDLFKTGKVLIVKDSSANKCGVICSSYEIIASMLLSGEEFRAAKPALVADVIQKLRGFARMEAELLFSEYRNFPGALPFFSERISKAINRLKDAVGQHLATLSNEQLYALLPVFHEHLPKALIDLAGNRIVERVPIPYIRNAIASTLASRLVYSEGTLYIDTLPPERVAELTIKYFQAEAEVKELVSKLELNQLDDEKKKRVARLVREGGVRTQLAAMWE